MSHRTLRLLLSLTVGIAVSGELAAYPQSAQPAEAPAPAAPRRRSGEYDWNVRLNPIDLLLGRGTAAVERNLAGPLSVAVAPTYVFSKPVYLSDPYDVKGWAVAAQLGIWVDGNPFRGMALKLHLEHETTTYTITDASQNKVSRTFGLNKVGALLVSQSIHGGWFSFSTGIGVVKDLSWNEADHTVICPGGDASTQCTVASGIGRGWDLLGEIALGVVFLATRSRPAALGVHRWWQKRLPWRSCGGGGREARFVRPRCVWHGASKGGGRLASTGSPSASPSRRVPSGGSAPARGNPAPLTEDS